eukprot:Gb_21648 [translate_table: standard]
MESNSVNNALYSEQTGEYFIKKGHSVVLQEKPSTGRWNVYRSARSPLKLVDRFPNHADISTLHDNFVHAVNSYPNSNYLGTRVGAAGTVGDSYKWMTYGEVGTARTEIGSGLIFHGIPKGSGIGVYLTSRPEWIVVDQACSSYSYISIPLYDTLGPDAAKYIINHAEIAAVFCVQESLEYLLKFSTQLPSLRLLIVTGPTTEEFMISSTAKTGNYIEIVSYSRLQEHGRASLQRFRPPMPRDIATICYTSGTTGNPKGVVITHANLIASAAGSSYSIKFYPSDVHFSHLPLAHIFERVYTVLMAYSGVAMGFSQGDKTKLTDDIRVLRPTVFISVPRLFNRIQSYISNSIQAFGEDERRSFDVAFASGKEALMNGEGNVEVSAESRHVFDKIRAQLGGRLRLMVSGAAPLSPHVKDFMGVCMGCRVTEVYGMTELSGGVSCCDEGDYLSGHVGSPNSACEIKLQDVPEMNYSCGDRPHPRGEICVRGHVVFRGYHKDAALTRDTIDQNGWLHTGDIGLWLPGGQLKVIDRKKSIFKLAQGEYIVSEKIENVYIQSKFVNQCFVYGDSLYWYLVAVVVVNADCIKAWAMSQGIQYDSLDLLCTDGRTRAAVLADMNRVAVDAQLRGFELVQAITIVAEPFSLENGLLTPTLKLRRHQAKLRFAKAISDMYTELSSKDVGRKLNVPVLPACKIIQ